MQFPIPCCGAFVVVMLAACLPCCVLTAQEQINPYPRRVTGIEKAGEWTFDSGLGGWKAMHHCRLDCNEGILRITSTGSDPYLVAPVKAPDGPIIVQFRGRCRAAGGGQFFWTTARDGRWGERRSKRFELHHDGKWHTCEVVLPVRGRMSALRLDPGAAPGTVEIDWIRLHRRRLHPLEIVRVAADGRNVRAWVKNHAREATAFLFASRAVTAEAGQTVEVALRAPGETPFEAVQLKVEARGLPDLIRTVFLHHPKARARWVALKSKAATVLVAPDGSGARLLRGGRVVAVLAPLVSRGGGAVKVKVTAARGTVRLAGEGVRARLALKGDELSVSIESDEPCEGPVLRVIGPLEQGLFAGLEYLGKGERSSSKLDVETAEHVRFAPDPLKVTMPLMACATERCTAAMTWADTSLQPVFASPNFFDGCGDHRMALRGRKIDATILLRRPQPIEEAVLWAVRKRGLPPLPKAPRSVKQQWALCLKSINGPISGKGGWGHCAEPRWGRHPYADVVSTIWRLTGEAPKLERLVPGGAHVRNDAIYFVTGRADEWLKLRRAHARRTAASQKPDGSFRYAGKYRRGHFEDTSSGWCARAALELLDFARLTGDREALDAGVKALEYMKRFRTPRGAQTWELSLHTPDVLASAYLVGAYLRGWQLTGKEEYLALGRRWALSGVPFVYLWGRQAVMTYATVPVYGATNWRAPNWMGLPVQWCGGVYAYWLAKLAPHEKTLDWRRLGEGILIAAEQMQYPNGAKLGCLPDVFHLSGQERAGPSINPCALVSLRLAVAGETESLAVAADGKHRAAAPFPVTIRNGKARVRARRGATYQVLVDGKRIVTVESKGSDVIDLE